MHISENHPSRKGGNGVGDAALQAAFIRGLCTEMDDRANVSLDHFTQRRVVFFLVFFFFLIWLALLHKIDFLWICVLIRLHLLQDFRLSF